MGQAKIWNNSLIDRVVDYVNRVMVDLKITPTQSQYGGFVERLVGVDEPVTKGQPIANVRNPFGDILETLLSPETGRMFQSPRDPSIEPGGSVGQIAYNSTDPDCADGCILSGPQGRR
jgi:predicted deacylase